MISKKKYLVITLAFVSIAGLYLLFHKTNINDLKHRTLSFDALPKDVTTLLVSIPRCEDFDSDILCVDSKEKERYEYRTIWLKEPIWIWHYKFTDKQRKKAYIIDRGTPRPFIVYRNKLYIPTEFNIFCGTELGESQYIEYQLK